MEQLKRVIFGEGGGDDGDDEGEVPEDMTADGVRLTGHVTLLV